MSNGMSWRTWWKGVWLWRVGVMKSIRRWNKMSRWKGWAMSQRVYLDNIWNQLISKGVEKTDGNWTLVQYVDCVIKLSDVSSTGQKSNNAHPCLIPTKWAPYHRSLCWLVLNITKDIKVQNTSTSAPSTYLHFITMYAVRFLRPLLTDFVDTPVGHVHDGSGDCIVLHIDSH